MNKSKIQLTCNETQKISFARMINKTQKSAKLVDIK